MKLQAYILNGKVINVDVFNWSLDQLNGNQPWIISENIQNGYSDITSITNWDSIGFDLKDYDYVRTRIKEIVTQIGFNNLPLNEKIISAKYFLVDKTERDSVLTEDEQIFYWDNLIVNSQDSRFKRWESAKKYISYKLSPVNSSDLAISTSSLCTNFINYNIVTKTKDGVSGLFDYLKGEGDYISNGYPSKSYWTQMDQNKIMGVLEKGDY
jgi:hypothetical protein